jgi:hypothetical protein
VLHEGTILALVDSVERASRRARSKFPQRISSGPIITDGSSSLDINSTNSTSPIIKLRSSSFLEMRIIPGSRGPRRSSFHHGYEVPELLGVAGPREHWMLLVRVVPQTALSLFVSASAFGLFGLTRKPRMVAAGINSCSTSTCFATSKLARKLTPVTLLPGRFMLATRPNLTGSAPIAKTMGIVWVAALAACTAAVLPVTAITAALRRRNSVTSDGI